MSVWTELDQKVRAHADRTAELVNLAKEGGRYRKPRFVPPCVWVLTPRANAPPPREPLICASFDVALEELKRCVKKGA